MFVAPFYSGCTVRAANAEEMRYECLQKFNRKVIHERRIYNMASICVKPGNFQVQDVLLYTKITIIFIA